MAKSLPRSVGARELKTRLGGYLRAVRAGATIVVTERGEPVAELRPLPRGARGLDSRLDALAARGMLSRGSGKPLPDFEPQATARHGTTQGVEAEREDRF
jgi:prevent-host-death family protein